MAYKIEQRLNTNNDIKTRLQQWTGRKETNNTQEKQDVRDFYGDVEEGLRLNVRKA